MKNLIQLTTILVVTIFCTSISAQDVVLTGSQVPATNTEFGQIRGYIHNDILRLKVYPMHRQKDLKLP